MFLSGVHEETGLEFANEVGSNPCCRNIYFWYASHLFDIEFPLGCVICEDFPWLLSSQSAQHTSVPSYGSAVFHIIEHVYCVRNMAMTISLAFCEDCSDLCAASFASPSC